MKKIIYTQRVEVIEGYNERRDCADQNIPSFLSECGFLPIPVPNIATIAIKMCEGILPDGIFFSGGNDLSDYGGDAPERDETEKGLLVYAVKQHIPLFGICRGMQFIGHYYGCGLEKVDGHIRQHHPVRGRLSRESVNSFHGMAIKEVPAQLEVLGSTDDGVIEAIQHKTETIAGIMWHPERVTGFSQDDIDLIKNFYEGGWIG